MKKREEKQRGTDIIADKGTDDMRRGEEGRKGERA